MQSSVVQKVVQRSVLNFQCRVWVFLCRISRDSQQSEPQRLPRTPPFCTLLDQGRIQSSSQGLTVAGFDFARPPDVRDNSLSLRLGWPSGRNSAQVLEHLATVREAVREVDGFHVRS